MRLGVGNNKKFAPKSALITEVGHRYDISVLVVLETRQVTFNKIFLYARVHRWEEGFCY